MRRVHKNKILREIRAGGIERFKLSGFTSVGGHIESVVKYNHLPQEDFYGRVTDEDIWEALPKQMIAEIEAADESDDLATFDWQRVKDWAKAFWDRWGELIKIGIQIFLALLMFMMEGHDLPPEFRFMKVPDEQTQLSE